MVGDDVALAEEIETLLDTEQQVETATASSAPATGQRFQLVEKLGVGGQGTTWRAIDHQTGREVAVKAFNVDTMDDWKDFDLFEREVEVLKGLDHPGIPTFVDTWADPEAGQYFLAMELVPGESLDHYVNGDGKTLDDDKLEALLLGCLDVLEYMHERKPPVIHRDIKPANIVERADDKFSIVDFGGVRVALKPGGGSTVVGTFGYMAPEQLHGQAQASTDLYSLGVTLAALASATPGDQLPRKGLKIDVDKAMGTSRLKPIVSKMVEPDPEKRPQSVVEVRELMLETFDASSSSSRLRAAVKSVFDDDELDDEELSRSTGVQPSNAPPFAQMIIWLFSTFGRMALSFVQYVFLPLFFFFGLRSRSVRRSSRRRRRMKLRQRQVTRELEKARKRLARTALKNDPDMWRQRRSRDHERSKRSQNRDRRRMRGMRKM